MVALLRLRQCSLRLFLIHTYSEHRFPAPSCKTLPELVTPLEGALFISAQLSIEACQRLPKGLGINMTVEAAQTSVFRSCVKLSRGGRPGFSVLMSVTFLWT